MSPPPFVLVHGAANSARVWTFWQRALAERGYAPRALDLRGHGEREMVDLTQTRMADYAAACVGLAPSAPAAQVDPEVPLRPGTFGAEAYGITTRDPDDQSAMPDLDREERALALASLGQESRLARYDTLTLRADWLSADASHWGLVLNRRALGTLVPAVAEWLTGRLGP